MKLLSITLNNFRQYYGKNTIRFSDKEGHNLTVIHGLNGAGKTALLNAFMWALYGKHKLPTDEPDYCRRAWEELEPDHILNVQVNIIFEHDDCRYDLQRWIEYKKTKNGDEVCLSKTPNISLSQCNLMDGSTVIVNNPKDYIKQILPEEMQPYFFFDGEDINRLGDTSRKDYTQRIKKAIKNLMDITIIENSIQDTNSVIRELRTQMSKSGDSQIGELSRMLNDIDSKIQSCNSEIENLRSEEDCINTNLSDIDKRLKKIAPVENLQKTRNELSVKQKENEDKLFALRKECCKQLQKYSALPFINDASSKALELIEAKRKKGVLPSGIRETFIKDILDSHMCICNRSFVDDDESYKALTDLLKKQLGNAEIDDRITELCGYAKTLDDRRNNFLDNLNSYLESVKEIKRNQKEINEKLSEISSQIESIAPQGTSEDPAELERQRRRMFDELRNINTNIGRQSEQIKILQENRKIVEQKLDNASKNDAKCRLLGKRIDSTRKVLDVLQSINTTLVLAVKNQVTEEINSILSVVTDDYLAGEVTEDFELKTYKKDNNSLVRIAASTGQQQVTSLAFIASLVKIAYQSLKNPSKLIQKGGFYPLVMDAPFSNVDPIYGPRIANVVSKETPQVILMTNPQQWKGVIESTLRQYVGAEYLIVKHSNNKKTNEGNNATVVLPSGPQKLQKHIDGIQFSRIEEV